MNMFNRKEEILRHVDIMEEDGDNKLSLLDIKAAIAEQKIPVSELYSKQDLSTNTVVVSLIHDAETKAKQGLVKEKVILQNKVQDLQAFKDKQDTLSLIKTSKSLADKSDRTIEYIQARLATGKGVDLSGDLTKEQRQDRVNKAIEEELNLIEEQGIVFKKKGDKSEPGKAFAEPDDEVDMTDPENNPLIPENNED